MAGFGTDVPLDRPFEEAIEGVISRIALDKAFAEKFGTEFRRYTILGAFKPGLPHQAVTARPDVGLLPCNVTVEEVPGGALVRLVDAGQVTAMGDLGDVPEIADLAADVDAGARLDQVATALRGG